MKSQRAFWRKTQYLHTVLLVVSIFVIGFVLGNQVSVSEAYSQNEAPAAVGDTDEAFAPFWEVFNIIQDRYIDTVETPVLVEGAINGMVEALGDEHSNYISPEFFPLFSSDLEGDIEGIGVIIRTIPETGMIEVATVLKGAPAMGVGVMPGDIFFEVDGQSVVGLNQTELAILVRGPAGTTVNITFLRDGEEVNFDIVRARIEIPNVETEILDGNIAYISMAEFNDLAYDQIARAVEEVNVNERAGLILDLRGNPGGLLRTALSVTSAFVENGVLLTEDFGSGVEQVFEANADQYLNINVPIVVLIDENSASASELFASALQDNGCTVCTVPLPKLTSPIMVATP